jgi:hypothetical protein
MNLCRIGDSLYELLGNPTDVGNPDPSLGQTQKCGRVKEVTVVVLSWILWFIIKNHEK